MSEFAQRLEAAAERGSLRTTDLARWFEAPYSTVKKWRERQGTPRGPRGREAARRLDILETCLKWPEQSRLPMPGEWGDAARAEHISKLREQVKNAAIPSDDNPGGGIQSRVHQIPEQEF